MTPRKRNKFFTFIFSFLPGAAEMYMGFMKNGLSLMAIFFGSIGLTAVSRMDYMIALVALIWFVGFFHAINVSAMEPEAFALYEDKYIWEDYISKPSFKLKDSTMRLCLSIALIVIGLSMAWGYIMDIAVRFIPEADWDFIYPIINDLPSFVIAVVLIIAGVLLIKGKKKELKEEEENGETAKDA